jgi:large repetitive protein
MLRAVYPIIILCILGAKVVVALNSTTAAPSHSNASSYTERRLQQVPDAWINKNENEEYEGRHECSFVQAGTNFYLIGGRENAKQLDTYNFGTDTWSQSAPATKEFNHFQATEYQGLIWVIGAFQTNSFPEEPDDAVRVYDPANNVWMDGPIIPADRRRGSTGLVIHNHKFYIVAGNNNEDCKGYVDWFDEYDPRTGNWTVLQPAPHPRDHFHAYTPLEDVFLVGAWKI